MLLVFLIKVPTAEAPTQRSIASLGYHSTGSTPSTRCRLRIHRDLRLHGRKTIGLLRCGMVDETA
jgi:hypothetical protein